MSILSQDITEDYFEPTLEQQLMLAGFRPWLGGTLAWMPGVQSGWMILIKFTAPEIEIVISIPSPCAGRRYSGKYTDFEFIRRTIKDLTDGAIDISECIGKVLPIF